MTTDEVMRQLEKMGSASIKKTLMRHGATEPLFGVKIQDLKILQKKIKKDHRLSLELYNTGNSDAMYLAGLIADETKMTKKDLNKWVKNSHWHAVSQYTVAWVAAESKHGLELALEWIESENENIAIAGWSTLSSLVAIKSDEELDIPLIEQLMNRVQKEIHAAPNYVRYTMNGFVIAVGCYIAALSQKARAIAKQIGKVTVNMGDTACKVPDAVEYIDKVAKANKLGKKRKEARC